MSDCVFCRILKGEIPAQKVHEDDRAVALLDINPVAPGHTLVLPRAHHETWTDLPPELASHLSVVAQAVARGVVKAQGAQGFNLLMNNHRCSGQAIPHAHFHVIPRKTDDGVKYGWPTKPAQGDELAKTAERIRQALKS
ncbi:MAG TPA: HIT family protein [Planctomycetota bacterium]